MPARSPCGPFARPLKHNAARGLSKALMNNPKQTATSLVADVAAAGNTQGLSDAVIAAVVAHHPETEGRLFFRASDARREVERLATEVKAK